MIGLNAISEPDERGMRTVMCIINRQLRPVVRDRSIAAEVPSRRRPTVRIRPHARAVLRGRHPHRQVNAGDTGDTIEANMEVAITTPRGGTISRLAIGTVQHVEGGDLLAVITATPKKPAPNDASGEESVDGRENLAGFAKLLAHRI